MTEAFGYNQAEVENQREWRTHLRETLREHTDELTALAKDVSELRLANEQAVNDLKLCRATFENVHKDVENQVGALQKEVDELKTMVTKHIEWCKEQNQGGWAQWLTTQKLIIILLGGALIAGTVSLQDIAQWLPVG